MLIRFAGVVCRAGCPAGTHVSHVERMCDRQAAPESGRSVVDLRSITLAVSGPDAAHGPPAANAQPARIGGLIVALDGAILNAEEVAAELAQRGRVLRYGGDAELMGLAFQEWGAAGLNRLSGLFAVALHDADAGTTVLARDPYGQKPLHYVNRDGHVYFSSELRSLLPTLPAPAPNTRALFEWLLYGDVLPPATLFEGVEVLPPGHLLKIPAGAATIEPLAYDDPTRLADAAVYKRLSSLRPSELVLELRRELERSVAECLRGSGPIGVLLSGGVDSSTTTALAARHREIRAYHLSVPEDPRLDERPAAERVARQLGVPLACIEMDGVAYRREVAPATWRNEMPLWHMQCVPFHLLARRAREDGIQVLLTGDSIGPLLGVYERHLAQRWLRPAGRLLQRLPEGAAHSLARAAHQARGLPVPVHGIMQGLVPSAQLIDGFRRAELLARCEEAYAFVASASERAVHGGKLADLSLWLPRFFHRGDRLCAAETVEYRNPFQDAASVRLALNLPITFIRRRGTGKWALKEAAARYIPRDLAFRAKVAWNLPGRSYLAPMNRPEFFEDGFLHYSFGLGGARARTWVAQWARDFPTLFRLVHLEVWGRLFVLGQSVEEVTRLATATP